MLTLPQLNWREPPSLVRTVMPEGSRLTTEPVRVPLEPPDTSPPEGVLLPGPVVPPVEPPGPTAELLLLGWVEPGPAAVLPDVLPGPVGPLDVVPPGVVPPGFAAAWFVVVWLEAGWFAGAVSER